MVLRYFQKGFNYSQDGPGNRLVYHLQGCNMLCPWCSNPEGMEISRESKSYTVSEAVNEIISCRPMFFDGGGVTFTGGEATLQLDAVYEIMAAVKAQGISTAIETNGTHKELIKLLGVCEYWIIDFKHPNLETHKKITGVSNETVKSNITFLSKSTEVHIRIPLIHGFNDDNAVFEGFISFFNFLRDRGGKFDVEILSYHEYGKEKWEHLGKEYHIKDGFVSEKTILNFENLLKNNQIKIIKT